MTAFIINLALVLLELRGFYLSLKEGGSLRIFVYYTEISNLVSLVSSLLFVLLGQTLFVTRLRYLACCMLVFTFFVCLCALMPMGAEPRALFLEGHCFYLHTACPVISTLSYILFENHAGKGMIAFSVGVTLLYGFTMLFLNAIGKVDGPYPFFRVREQSGKATVLWMAVLCLAALGLSSGLWLLAGK